MVAVVREHLSLPPGERIAAAPLYDNLSHEEKKNGNTEIIL
jgi:hypothetical protein